MTRRELTVINEMMPNSTIRDEIGIRMETELKKRAVEKMIHWLENVCAVEFDMETGEGKDVYNVSKIGDIMWVRELLRYNPKLNTDRMCFPKDTKVLTPIGYKNIQDFKLGDNVISHDSSINKVIELHENQYNKKLYKFKVLGQFNTLDCTEEHPILIGRRSKPVSGTNWLKNKANIDLIDFILANEVKEKDMVLIPKRTNLKSSSFTPEELYIMGWYFGDGYLSSENNNITFMMGINEEDKVKQVVNILNSFSKNRELDYRKKPEDLSRKRNKNTLIDNYLLPARYKKESKKQAFKVHYTNKKFAKTLRNYVGTPHNKFIHEDIFNSSDGLPFIAGLFASDGHFKNGKNYDGCNRYCLEWSTIYEDAAVKVRQMLLDYGIWCTIRKVYCSTSKHTQYNSKDQYKIEVQGQENINKLSSCFNIYPQVETNRRNELKFYVEKKYGFWVQVKKIETEEFDSTVYNLGVENTHTYVAENIAVHNCANLCALIAIQSDSNRHIINEVSYAPKEKPKNVSKYLPSPFQSKGMSTTFKKLPSPFARK